MLRRILLFGMLLFGGLPVLAQTPELKVVVRNDADEAMAYAYVYLNGRAVAVTDSLGVGTIASGRLTLGDTLGVSYVGVESKRAVYDAAMQQRGEWNVVLVENYRPLVADAVVVRTDVEALFRQNVRKFWLLYTPHTASTRFTAEIGGRKVEGRVTATHLPGDTSETTYLKRGLYWYHMPLRIGEMSDPAAVATDRLHNLLHLAFYYPGWELSVASRDGRSEGSAVRYGYIGKHDDCRLFRISYPEVREGTNRYSVQLIIWVGMRDQRIRRIEAQAVYLDNEETWIHLDATYALSSINARTLVFDRVEAIWPGSSVTLSDPEFRAIRPNRKTRF